MEMVEFLEQTDSRTREERARFVVADLGAVVIVVDLLLLLALLALFVVL